MDPVPHTPGTPFDTTLEAPVAPRVISTPPGDSLGGTAPDPSATLRALWQSRLRSAALALCVGSEAFLLKRALYDRIEVDAETARLAGGHLLFIVHAANVVVLWLIAVMLWRRERVWSWAGLRLIEAVMFGSTAVCFALLQHQSTIYSLAQFGTVDVPVAIWCGLVLVYALFIPNSWRRAALVIGLVSVVPSLTLAVDFRWFAAEPVPSDQQASLAAMMFVLWGIAVYGSSVAASWRREQDAIRQFGSYRLKQRIGTGGMGEVYLAEHEGLKRRYAIKLIRPGKAADPLALARFEREVRVTASLTHWNTIEIFDVGRTDEGTFYYVMEYLPGMSVLELVERYGPLPPGRAIHLLEQTADALREAHGIGLIHRDVKPGNIFAAQRGGVYDIAKLLDFGIVKPSHELDRPELTLDGQITGSPLYMSPEQAANSAKPDARSDVYSLGAVAYFMLTGRPPFSGDRGIQVLLAHVHDPVTPPRELRPDLPGDLEQIVLRCLAKNPQDRFQDMGSLRDALLACEAAGSWTRQDAARWWEEPGRMRQG